MRVSKKTIPDDWAPRFDFGLLEVVNFPVNWLGFPPGIFKKYL